MSPSTHQYNRKIWEDRITVAVRDVLDGDAVGSKLAVLVLLVAGAQDGPLPGSMKQTAADLGNHAESNEMAQFKIIDGASHLPMIGQPEAFFGVVN